MKKLIFMGLFLMSLIATSCNKPSTETVDAGDTVLVETDTVKVDTIKQDTVKVDTIVTK